MSCSTSAKRPELKILGREKIEILTAFCFVYNRRFGIQSLFIQLSIMQDNGMFKVFERDCLRLYHS